MEKSTEQRKCLNNRLAWCANTPWSSKYFRYRENSREPPWQKYAYWWPLASQHTAHCQCSSPPNTKHALIKLVRRFSPSSNTLTFLHTCDFQGGSQFKKAPCILYLHDGKSQDRNGCSFTHQEIYTPGQVADCSKLYKIRNDSVQF